MTILAVDSSALPVSAALSADGKVIAEFTISIKLTHSETLMPLTDSMLKGAGVELKDIDALAVAAGPGSFTGLRIGSATVKGLAEALDIPIVSVPTLRALAFNVFAPGAVIAPMMDARRKNVYTALYEYRDGFPEEVLPQTAMPLTELIARVNELKRETVFTGDGTEVFREDLDREVTVPHFFAPANLRLQRAGAVAVLAEEYMKKGEYTDAAGHKPDYLKKSQAEREKAEAEKNGTLKELSAGGHSLYV